MMRARLGDVRHPPGQRGAGHGWLMAGAGLSITIAADQF
jgi:hypothetical protein